MTQYIIDVGAAPNDGDGDPIRTAFEKVNNNFSQLFSTPGNAIISGTTNFSIPITSGNANITVGNVANIAVFTTTGVVVTRLTSNGNVSGSNLLATGLLSSNTLTTTGNANIGGNLNVTGNAIISGNITYNDITSLVVSDPLIYIGANNFTNTVDLGLVASFNPGVYQHTGLVRNYLTGTWNLFSNVVAEPTTTIDWANAVYDPLLTGPITASNVTANLITSNGNVNANIVNANNFAGSGARLTSITAANISGTVANATYAVGAGTAATVTTNAQPNITSVGTLASLSATGNVTGGNLVTGNFVFTTGGIYTDNYFYANGNPFSGSNYGNSNVANYLPTFSGNIGNLTVTGNISAVTAANGTNSTQLATTAFVTNAVTVAGGYGNAQVAAYLPNYTGNLVSMAGPVTTTANVTAGNVLTGGLISATGNVTGGNILTAGLVSATGSVAAASVVGGIITGSSSSVTGNVTGASLVGTIATASQTAITAVGTLTSLNSGTISSSGNVTAANVITGGFVTATGNITAGNLSVGNGTITVNNIVNAGANLTGNIGSSTNYFNTVFAQATSAVYADLAEVYIADTPYAPGTVLSFGGTAEVTQSTVDLDPTVAGVVSTNPAYIMNTAAVDPNMVIVALTGRVPTSVTGSVTKGAMMVSNGDGTARAERNPVFGSVIGKALESFTGTTGVIEIVVGRL
jgi:hypothetical protein